MLSPFDKIVQQVLHKLLQKKRIRIRACFVRANFYCLEPDMNYIRNMCQGLIKVMEPTSSDDLQNQESRLQADYQPEWQLTFYRVIGWA